MAEASDYAEISKCVPGVGVNLNLGANSLYSGCNCIGQCEFRTGSAVQCNNCTCAYKEDGHLSAPYLEHSSAPVIECNSNCTCDHYCLNRTTQRVPSTNKVTVIRTDNKGLGVASHGRLQQGAFVSEYVGELITSSMAKERLMALGNADKCFILQYREHLSNGNIMTTNVDATFKGNVTRFINHSCAPNLIMVPIRSDSIVPRLCLFTCNDVEPGEELSFSYFARRDSNDSPRIGNKKCYCGSSNCIGYLPLDCSI